MTMSCEVEAKNKGEALETALACGHWEEDTCQCRNDVLDNCEVEEI